MTAPGWRAITLQADWRLWGTSGGTRADTPVGTGRKEAKAAPHRPGPRGTGSEMVRKVGRLGGGQVTLAFSSFLSLPRGNLLQIIRCQDVLSLRPVHTSCKLRRAPRGVTWTRPAGTPEASGSPESRELGVRDQRSAWERQGLPGTLETAWAQN